MNKIASITMISLATISITAFGTMHKAHAIGYNPAFEKNNASSQNQKATQTEIFNTVHSQLNSIMPLTYKAYLQTPLEKSLNTNYNDVGYPSKTNTKDGIDSSGNIDINSLKKPISQPDEINMADLLRYYYFSFTTAKSFSAMTDTSPVAGQVTNGDQKSFKLNYFDYITLINTIKSNPNLDNNNKNKQLTAVEDDLQSSIDTLYGLGANVNSSTGNLSAWGNSKSVSVPFSNGMYSYIQLLAAYRKTQPINDTLSFYSSLLDTLYTIKNYSAAVRQGDKNATINEPELAKNISEKYQVVDKSVVQPMLAVVKAQNKLNSDLEKADSWQTNKLGDLGLTDKNQGN